MFGLLCHVPQIYLLLFLSVTNTFKNMLVFKIQNNVYSELAFKKCDKRLYKMSTPSSGQKKPNVKKAFYGKIAMAIIFHIPPWPSMWL